MKIGAGLVLDGEREFKQAVSSINKDLSVLGSEMGKVTAQFGKNSESMDSLRAKSDLYERTILSQKDKVNALREALVKSANEYGEADKRTKDWQISLNKAEADLANTQNSLNETTKKMNEFGNEANQGGDKVEVAGNKAKESGNDAEKGKSGWSNLGTGIKKAGEIAGKAVLALGTAALAAAAGVAKITTVAAEAADEINTLSKQTGLSTDEIQKFKYASEQIDVPLETLTGSMAKLVRNMAAAQSGTGQAADAFKALGISITDSNGQLRSNQDVFNEAINALAGMENATQRDAYAMQIFGKSAQDLNPLILGGADALKKLGEEAEKAGLILGQDALDNLNALQDSIDTFKATAAGSGNLFATAFAGPIAKSINDVTGYMKKLALAFNKNGFSGVAKELGGVIGDIIKNLSRDLPKIIDFGVQLIQSLITGIQENIPAITKGAMEIINTLVTGLLQMLPQIIEMGLQLIISLAKGLAESIPKLIPVMIETVNTIVDTLIENLPLLIDAAIQLIMAIVKGILDNLPKLIEASIAMINKLVEGLVNAIPQLIDGVIQLVLAIVDFFTDPDNLITLVTASIQIVVAIIAGLIQAIPQLIAGTDELVKAIWGKIQDTDWLQLGKDLVNGIADGIKSMGSILQDALASILADSFVWLSDLLGFDVSPDLIRKTTQDMYGSQETNKTSTSGASSKAAPSVTINNYSPKALDQYSIMQAQKRDMQTYQLGIAGGY